MWELIPTSGMTSGLILAMLGLLVWVWPRRSKGMPPGPMLTLPVIGNLIQVGSDPVLSFRKMRKQYGEIFSVFLANRLVIVINGFENIKEAFVKNSEIFAGRPFFFIIKDTMLGKGIVFSEGAVWREHRKLAITALRNLGMGRNTHEESIQREVARFMEHLTLSKGKAFDIEQSLYTSVANVVCLLVLGKGFQYDDRKWAQLLKAMKEDMNLSPIVQFLPFLRFVPGDYFHIERTRRNFDMVKNDLIYPSINEHKKHYNDENINDFIGAYIQEMKNKELNGQTQTSLNEENLHIAVGDLFIAGTEAVATTFRWILVCLFYFPENQDRCFAEINRVVGRDRPVCIQDKNDIPFVEATIMEMFRYIDVGPIGLLHCVTEDVDFKGYKLPKGIPIISCMDSVLADPNIWGDPDNFRPDRFIDENGKLTKPEEFIPFFLGRRNCLGETLARMELFLFLSNVLQKFHIVLAEGETLPSLEGRSAFLQSPPPFKIRAIPRD